MTGTTDTTTDVTELAATVTEQVEAFVRGEGQVAPDDPDFDHAVELFDEGYLDSLGVVRLIQFVEATFDLTLSDETLLDRRFTTIAGIGELLAGQLAAA